MTDHAKLIAELETEKFGSRDLDCQMALALGWLRRTPSEMKNKRGGWVHPNDVRNGEIIWDSLHGTSIYRDPPMFTRNLQDAVDAVPENEWWCLSGPHNQSGGRYRGGPKSYDVAFISPINAHATTPALALCIAVLKAKDPE